MNSSTFNKSHPRQFNATLFYFIATIRSYQFLIIDCAFANNVKYFLFPRNNNLLGSTFFYFMFSSNIYFRRFIVKIRSCWFTKNYVSIFFRISFDPEFNPCMFKWLHFCMRMIWTQANQYRELQLCKIRTNIEKIGYWCKVKMLISSFS